MKASLRTIFLGVSIFALAAVLFVWQSLPVTAVTVGNDEINFITVRYDYPSTGQSTWYYQVISGRRPAISHVTFQMNLDCLDVVDAGTWDGTNLDALNSGAGQPEVGTDPTTGVTGLKFDQGFVDNEVRYYYFTVDGNYAQSSITVASKGGPGYDTALITGPSLSCQPQETPSPTPTNTPTPVPPTPTPIPTNTPTPVPPTPTPTNTPTPVPPTPTPTPTNTPTTCVTAAVDLELLVNGEDADSAPGPTVPVGSTVTWTYVVTNNGGTPLTNIAVFDQMVGATPVCTQASLGVGLSFSCERTTTAQAGQFVTTAKVTAFCDGVEVTDRDKGYYTGQ